jgi:hypothetical protein
MTLLYMLLYLLAGVFFGLAAGRKSHRVDWLALGLLLFAVVNFLKTAQNV